MRTKLSPAGVSPERLRRSLPAPAYSMLKAVGELADALGYRAYLVGGIVRDLLVGYPNTDFDLVIEGKAEEVARRFAARLGTRARKHTEFGTCKVDAPGLGTVDFATSRTETYRRPGALPEVAASEIASDLARRDFTINAMAIRLDPGEFGSLLDPCGGLADLERGQLRVMHDASFRDDPTRILRGARFAARYGLAFDRHTRSLIGDCLAAGGLDTISGKRIYTELRLVSLEASAPRGLRMLDRLGVLAGIRPGGARAWARRLAAWRAMPRTLGQVEGAAGDGYARPWVSYLASLFVGSPTGRTAAVLAWLNPPRDVREACRWSSASLDRVAAALERGGPGPVSAVRLLGGVPPEGMVMLHAVGSRRVRRLVTAYLSRWRHVTATVSGGAVAALGLGPGPHVGRILAEIARLKLDGRLPTTEDELAYARGRVARLAKRRGTEARGRQPRGDCC
jgi:tRNA nucleotidyltransferase (CCA-adding enzyme)